MVFQWMKMLQVLWPLQRCSCGPRSCPSRLTCRRIAQRSCRFQEALSSQKVGKAWKTHKVGSSQKVGKARSIQSLDTITHIEHDASVWHLLDAVSDAALAMKSFADPSAHQMVKAQRRNAFQAKLKDDTWYNHHGKRSCTMQVISNGE